MRWDLSHLCNDRNACHHVVGQLHYDGWPVNEGQVNRATSDHDRMNHTLLELFGFCDINSAYGCVKIGETRNDPNGKKALTRKHVTDAR
jgi:hypothetical protein